MPGTLVGGVYMTKSLIIDQSAIPDGKDSVA
jgi:hypothetical protein